MEDFATHPEVAILAIVKEFYATIVKQEGDYVFVKGKKGWFYQTTINEFSLNDLGTL